MAVRRIVANVAADKVSEAGAFYGDILGMQVAMDLGWIVTLKSDAAAAPQISIASEDGSGTAVPDLSVEVDNFDEVLERRRNSSFKIEYGPVNEPWVVKRFYVRDPFGSLVNVLTHLE